MENVPSRYSSSATSVPAESVRVRTTLSSDSRAETCQFMVIPPALAAVAVNPVTVLSGAASVAHSSVNKYSVVPSIIMSDPAAML